MFLAHVLQVDDIKNGKLSLSKYGLSDAAAKLDITNEVCLFFLFLFYLMYTGSSICICALRWMPSSLLSWFW